MSELTIELDRLIQKAALDGALTQDAVAQFHDILAENEDFKTQLETDVDKIKADALMIDSLKTDLSIAKGLNKVAAEAEVAMIEREKNITTLELTAKHMGQRVEDHKEMFTTVFRNSVLRKEVMTPVEGLSQDQYGTSHSPYAQKDSVEEKEE